MPHAKSSAFVRLFTHSLPIATGCRLWLGPLSANGFGLIRDDAGCVVTIQKLAHTLAIGPVPPGSFVHQACGVPRCISPDHLELGSRRGQQQRRRPKVSR